MRLTRTKLPKIYFRSSAEIKLTRRISNLVIRLLTASNVVKWLANISNTLRKIARFSTSNWKTNKRLCFLVTRLEFVLQLPFGIFRNILCPQQMSPCLRGMDTKQMFCVPLVCPPKKHHEQQCVRNIVSSFAPPLNTQSTGRRFGTQILYAVS